MTGVAIEVEFETEEAQAFWEITIVSEDGKVMEVKIDSESGKRKGKMGEHEGDHEGCSKEKRGNHGEPHKEHEGGGAMDSESKRSVTVRIHEGHDPGDWELFAPDGTLLEGWPYLSVGRDHSGRYTLHVTFDQFECIDAEGQPVEVHLVCPIAKHHEELAPLPSARMHRRSHQ